MSVKTIYRGGSDVVRAVAKKEKEKYFLNNEDFKSWLKLYRQSCLDARSKGLQNPQIPNNIGKAFTQIATALSKHHKFIHYSWSDEFVGDAVLRCCEKISNFDPDRGTSAFAYFYQCCYFEFLERIKSEKKQKIVKASIVQNIGVEFSDLVTQEQDDGENYKTSMGEILSLNSMEIDYGGRKKKQIQEIDLDIFDIEGSETDG